VKLSSWINKVEKEGGNKLLEVLRKFKASKSSDDFIALIKELRASGNVHLIPSRGDISKWLEDEEIKV